MPIARHAQVIGVTDVGAKLELVIALDLGPVAHELVLVFTLEKRAIARVLYQRVAEMEVARARHADRESRHSCRIRRVNVQSRDSRIFGGCGTQATRCYLHMITQVPETEVGQKSRTKRIVEATGDAVISNARDASEATCIRREAIATQSGPKQTGTGTCELLQTVAPEYCQPFTRAKVGPDVETIGIEYASARSSEVVAEDSCRR